MVVDAKNGKRTVKYTIIFVDERLCRNRGYCKVHSCNIDTENRLVLDIYITETSNYVCSMTISYILISDFNRKSILKR